MKTNNPWKAKCHDDGCGGIKMPEKILVVNVAGSEWYAAWRYCRKRWECWAAERPLEDLVGKTPVEAMGWIKRFALGHRWKPYDFPPLPPEVGEV